MNKKAISFVEIIISISIIVLLATIWLAYKASYDDNKFNTKVLSDLSTLNNSFLAYKQENSTLPNPGWNINYYKEDSSYSHDQNWAYWVHGFVTDNIIPKKYLNYLPIDPRTNQFYAYWKTTDNNYFQIAWITWNSWEYKTNVQGNYNQDKIVWLIREYNWPQFLYNDTTDHFPYNPEQRLLVAKIATYTWSVNILTQNWQNINTNLIYKTLTNWDTIKTGNNSQATIYFSDGSKSQLKQNSSLKIDTMDYSSKENEYNLITKVKLILEQWTIWTKASRLNKDGSEFEISTQDATAAVRWTIFGVQVKNWQTNIKLDIWKIDVLKKDWNLIKTLEVNSWEQAKNISIKNWNKLPTSTNINSQFIKFIFPSNFNLKVKSIKNWTSWKTIEFDNSFDKWKLYVNNIPKSCNINTTWIDCNIWTISKNSKIFLCKTISPEHNQSCTKEVVISNLVYNQVKQEIPTNTDIENTVELSNTNSEDTTTPHSEEDNTEQHTSNWTNPSYTPCNWSFTPWCIITVWLHKLQLTWWSYSWNWCWWICGWWIKWWSWPFDWFLWINNYKEKRCKSLIKIDSKTLQCAEKRWWFKGKKVFWVPIPEYTWFDTSWWDWYTYTELH